jgi:hypothetical protein
MSPSTRDPPGLSEDQELGTTWIVAATSPARAVNPTSLTP